MAQATQLKTEEKGEKAERMMIILSKGTMDMVYPALMIATTAATMGKEVHMFFTFWGLQAVSKKKVGSLKVSPVGNPGMPMPNILGMIPGMTAMAKNIMNGSMKKQKVPSIPEMYKKAKDLGVKLHACSTTMEVMGTPKETLIDEIDDVVGAASLVSLSERGQIIFI